MERLLWCASIAAKVSKNQALQRVVGLNDRPLLATALALLSEQGKVSPDLC